MNKVIVILLIFLSCSPSFAEDVTSDRTYYVRLDGNPSNTGLADNASGALRYVQNAVDKLHSLVIYPGHTVTIRVRAGTHVADPSQNFGTPVFIHKAPIAGSGKIKFVGDVDNPSSVVLEGSSAAFWCRAGGSNEIPGLHIPNPIHVEGFRLIGGSWGLLSSCGGGGISLGKNVWGGATGVLIGVNYWGANITTHDVQTVDGNAQNAVWCDAGSCYFRHALNFVGTRTYQDTVYTMHGGGMLALVPWTGSVIGRKYRVTTGSWFRADGAANIPGNVDGIVESGGAFK